MNDLRSTILSAAPAEYRTDFSDSDIESHIDAIERLSSGASFVLQVDGFPSALRVTVVSYDRPGLFSMITGLLSSAGLSIERGNVYTIDLDAERSDQEGDAGTPERGSVLERFMRSRRAGRFAGAPGSPVPAGSPQRRKHHRHKHPRAEAPTGKVIIDRFEGHLRNHSETGAPVTGERPVPSDQSVTDEQTEDSSATAGFRSELTESFESLFRLLDEKGIEAGRRMVAERVAGRLAALQPSDGLALAPISIEEELNNEGFTRMQVRSADTPFFLYALSNALSLHSISIERVSIETVGEEIRDVFDIAAATSGGAPGPIRDRAQLDRIRLSILLTKQFTFVLDRAPDPYEALARFDRLIQDLGEEGEDMLHLFADRELQQELAMLLGASDFVWEDFVRRQREQLLPMLERIEQHELLSCDELEIEPKLREEIASGTISGTIDERVDALNAFKDRQSFLIDLDHMLSSDVDFFFLSRRLTALADAVIRAALDLAWEETTARYGIPRTAAGIPARYAAFGLGKLGGSALGYASDIELLFLYSDSGDTDGTAPDARDTQAVQNSEFFEQLFRSAVRMIRARREGIFQTDLRLRPHGDDGPLAVKLDRFVEYYTAGGPAHSAERLAMTRLRHIAGDTEFASRVIRIRDEILYQRDSVRVPAVRELRKTQLDEKLDGTRLNAKFSPGGLVDLEYNVQILQITHGRHNPALRCPGIHEALAGLRDEGTISDEDTEAIIAAYRFLRRLINGLRMLRGNAQDLFMPDPESAEYAHLARRIGYRRGGELSETDQLKVDVETHTAIVRGFVERYLGADAIPGEVEGGPADLVLSPSLTSERRAAILARAGIRDPERASANIRAIAGYIGDDADFSRVLVLAWDPLRRVADADMALNNWERFVRSCPSTSGHLADILTQPQRLDILFTIFSSSQFLSDILASESDIFSWITTRETVETRFDDAALSRALRADRRAVAGLGHDAWLSALRRFRKRHILRIGTRDICLGESVPVVTGEIASLARAIVRVALEAVWCRTNGNCTVEAGPPGAESVVDSERHQPIESDSAPSATGPAAGRARSASPRRLAVFAFGKLGGAELNYSSDIDLLAVYEPAGVEGELAAYTAVVRELIRDLADFTTEGQCYRVDMRLRPHGIAGSLVIPAERALDYYRNEAGLWEKQALLKLSRIAGDPSVGRRFRDGIQGLFAVACDPADARSGVAHLRALAVDQNGPSTSSLLARPRPGAAGKPEPKLAGSDIKNGEGGIRDIEFAVQVLQLIHAHRSPQLVIGNTLHALDALEEAAVISSDRAVMLARWYSMLRKVEHFLQLYGDRQLHTIPSDDRSRERLAASVGGGAAPADFFDALSETMGNVRAFYREVVEGK